MWDMAVNTNRTITANNPDIINLNWIYTVNIYHKTTAFINLIKSLMKSVRSVETGWTLNEPALYTYG